MPQNSDVKIFDFQYPTKMKSSCGDLSMPAVHPELDTTSRKTSNSGLQKSNSSLRPAKEFVDLNSYLVGRKSSGDEESKASKDFGSMFDSKPRNNVINFSSCKLDTTGSSILDKIIAPSVNGVVKEPAAKKRKIKMVAVQASFDEIKPEPSTSFDGNKTSVDSKELGKVYLKEVCNIKGRYPLRPKMA